MKIAVTGASGFLGGPLVAALRERGHEVAPARRSDAPDDLRWSVDEGFDPPDALSGFDVVVHLAAENIGAGRWTDERKAAILRSREQGTRRVVEALEAASPRPRALVCASGISLYGDTGATVVDESGAPASDFIARVAVAWEAEANKAEALDVRVACMRTSMVLGRGGGALAKMLPAFRLGVGGRLGSGEQYMSWIHLDDAIAAYVRVIESDDMSGAYNVTAPNPVTNRVFTDALGEALHRPTIIPVPRFALKTLFGEMSDLLLTGQRAEPRRLLEAGFSFDFADLRDAFADLLG